MGGMGTREAGRGVYEGAGAWPSDGGEHNWHWQGMADGRHVDKWHRCNGEEGHERCVARRHGMGHGVPGHDEDMVRTDDLVQVTRCGLGCGQAGCAWGETREGRERATQ